MIILAGDIGGTKTMLQLARFGAGGLDVLHEKRFASDQYGDFFSLASEFLDASYSLTGVRPAKACLGVAGPVSGRVARTTNLPWTLDADALESLLSIEHIRLINDFQAVGYGVDGLTAEDVVVIQEGQEKPQATRAILGAGTGLGQALLVWQAGHYEVIPSEGGHTDFAPNNEEEVELLSYLRARYRWATWERVVSGRGLVNIFDFLVEQKESGLSIALQQAVRTEDPAAAISRFGAEGRDPVAARALDIFIRLYGAQAGNLALTALATGGVYLAGGIAPKIIDKLKSGAFMAAFCNKDSRMQPLLRSMPVRAIVNQNVGLLGSAIAASRL